MNFRLKVEGEGQELLRSHAQEQFMRTVKGQINF